MMLGGPVQAANGLQHPKDALVAPALFGTMGAGPLESSHGKFHQSCSLSESDDSPSRNQGAGTPLPGAHWPSIGPVGVGGAIVDALLMLRRRWSTGCGFCCD
eukprot:CAMPEP_0204021076 /NCGR_PEP_ID=MMETSP0360-20130528/29848_1 /ASSEMBLY_ACC=CAM_ASM_000342 /TAXON_ID=268821 /ORGANISM="Scrippsiella Hangoei, Strain SHTV-5" /LENGTH=101 /DNA_ID=CAMNT_0050964443 /DNA_START=59 /DNA_END=361 /DNA_ORIENTATION=-